ncbi:MAG: hypothetical protein V4718_04555 [Pseudomonadota bacterium]
MTTLPTRAAIIDPATTNAEQKTNIGDQRDFIAEMLGTDSSNKAAARELLGLGQPLIQDFRLSLTTAVPVTTADVTGATTLYATPFAGKNIALYDGTNWNVRQSAEFSVALGALTASIGYDVFCYDNAGVPTLELLAWTSATVRATALVRQDGVLVKSGAPTRRYMGSFYTTSTTTTADAAVSTSGRYLFNYANRKVRNLLLQVATANWTYTTATWRQANNSASNQVNWFVGVIEDAVEIHGVHVAVPTNAVGTAAAIGLNSTTTPSGLYGSGKSNSSSSIPGYVHTPKLKALPQLGLNKACLLEWSEAIDTTSWYGVVSSSSQQIQSGLIGEVMA